MNFVSRMRNLTASIAIGAMLAAAPAAFAQDAISETHLAAARSAITALKLTDQFDAVLPAIAQQLQAEMTQKNPNLSDKIGEIVQAKALEVVGKRADLEKEVANVYAKSFTEQELNDIAAFYNSEAGKKLIGEGPIATREMMKAAEVWQVGLARELAEKVGTELSALPQPEQQAAPAEPAQDAAPKQ